jgi:hypothetical protein
MTAEHDGYRRHKEAARERQAGLSRSGRDIGPIPDVVDPARRERAALDLEFFYLAYFPQTFPLPFSPDHKRAIAKAKQATLLGGLFALAMPRAGGKTSMCERLAIWAVLYGHRSFVPLLGSSEKRAGDLLASIKGELETNELLLEDFPEVCHPIRCLEGIANRCKGQLCGGERTRITWTANKLVLPTVAGSVASGAVITVAGLTGSIRGMKHLRADGVSIRPDLVIPDDPQTDESARSASQCETRERILAGAVLGLAGPTKAISGIMPCTVISPGDMADRLLDPVLHPEWNGERTKLLYQFPDRMDLWERYTELRADSMRAGRRGEEATEFYRQHRPDMDRGAVVAWPERHLSDELSAVQYCMNLWARDEAAFWAEYQNDPAGGAKAEEGELTAELIAGRASRLKRGVPPATAAHLTAFIDVHQSLLYWCVAAWDADFTGAVVDYGTFPGQRRPYFQLRDARPTIAQETGVNSVEGAVYAGLVAASGLVLGREWQAEGGSVLRVERCLVDANWGQTTDVVRRFCRQSPHAAALTPSHGRGIGASASPIGDWKKNPGERRGHNWIIPAGRAAEGRKVIFDSNYWKSFVRSRLACPLGERGSLTLFGDRPAQHRLFSEHLTAEYRVETTGRGRKVDEWRLRPEKPDNHWWDCLVGCAVAASMAGAALAVGGAAEHKGRKRVSYRDMQARARAGR